ncbi:MAG: pantetheine-phosphate adenylyltransferase [Calditrichaeota bacterium]|nr:pantetheine-phosphate adenylyltransferase [Calditrichota bacterium]MCB9366062.1 pantetheine-phosphate adenylyltransferase [Calditrichota bacterium]MCB9391812.1 pantetheine-phosphate adenylyltransferase [Calditrichota bacterium]
MRTAIYPGTFDPITYGHLDVIERAAALFDRVIVTLAIHSQKTPLFTTDERQSLIEKATAHLPGVSVGRCKGLLVEYARDQGAIAIIRGLRAVSDFDYEFQIALANRVLAPVISTVFLMPGEQYTYLNSSIVREVARLGGRVDSFVPAHVASALQEKFRSPEA